MPTGLRLEQPGATLPSTLVAPMLQQRIGGTPIGAFPSPVDLLGFGNAQLHTFPRFVAGPVSYTQGPVPASLVGQLAPGHDHTAAAVARAMHLSPDERGDEQKPRAPPNP